MTTPPLTPAAGDLRDFPHTPVYRARLFASEFHAQATDAEWRAGLTLWVKSWDQVPAGSLPVDDVSLCRLAELGRDLKSWKKIKDGAMRGWILCTDGRMYHPTVAEGVNHALDAKVAQRNKTSAARIAALQKKLTASTDMEEKQRLQSEIEKVQQTLKQALSLNEKPSVTDLPLKSVTDPATGSKEKVREGEGKEKGLFNSEPEGSGDKSPQTVEVSESDLWASAVELLTGQGAKEATARSFIGGLRKQHGNEITDAVIQAAVLERPAEARAWIAKACIKRASDAPRTQGFSTPFRGRQNHHTVDFLTKDYEKDLQDGRAPD
ncbi:MAG: hypothetical protein Q7K57_44755 [Burkholderiaceae bacterium]|nr:hypothetical protein [Burkholderiaceae bacterium]